MNKFLYLLAGLFFFQSTIHGQTKDIDSNLKDSINFVIATTRKPLTEKNIFFGKELSDSLYYIKAFLSRGKWQLIYLNSLDQAFAKTSNAKDNLIYVHGDGQSFNDVLQSGIKMINYYNVNLILFDYPSKNEYLSSIKNFFLSRENARKSVPHFCNFIKEIEQLEFKKVNTSHTSILFHSLGNEILKSYADIIKKENPDKAIFENLIMNAPAVKFKNHHKWISNLNFHENLYIVYNKRDFVLNGASLITMNRQLGRKAGKKPYQEAIYISMKKVAKRKHNFFIDKELLAESPATKYFFDYVLHGNKPDLKNECAFKKGVRNKNNIFVIQNDSECILSYDSQASMH